MAVRVERIEQELECASKRYLARDRERYLCGFAQPETRAGVELEFGLGLQL